MAVNTSQLESRRRVIALTAFGVLTVALILFARIALDIALVLAICAVLFLIERTAGDWLNEALGASFGTLIFASVTALFLWLLLMTDDGQSAAERFFALADEHGFHTAFVQRQIIPPSSVRRLPDSAPGQTAAPSSADASDVTNPPSTETESGSAGTDAASSHSGRGTKNGNTVPTQVALELTQNRAKVGERVVATATVRAAGEAVSGGVIVFSVNGLSRAVPVKDGIATVDIVEMLSGRCEVRAQYRGTSLFAAASSSLAVLIIE